MDGNTGGRRELRRQLEENPDWESDLLALYGFDIWDAIDGRVPLRRAITLLDRLAYEPKSVWRAKQLGGPELEDYSRYLNWDTTTYVLADLIDVVRENTAVFVGANSEGHKMPEFDPYPRPDHQKVQSPKASLDNFANNLITMFGPGHI